MELVKLKTELVKTVLRVVYTPPTAWEASWGNVLQPNVTASHHSMVVASLITDVCRRRWAQVGCVCICVAYYGDPEALYGHVI